MEIDFFKLHTCTSDYILVNLLYKNQLDQKWFSSLAKKICRRKTGVGANGVIYLVRGDEFSVRLVYRDRRGKEGVLCNDALMCAGRFAFDSGLADQSQIVMETDWGIKAVEVIDSTSFRIDLGPPMATDMISELRDLSDVEVNRRVEIDGRTYIITPLHLQKNAAVVIAGEDGLNISYMGKKIRESQSDPDLVPVFVRIYSREEIAMAGWRVNDLSSAGGAGAVAAVLNGFCDPVLTVNYRRHALFVQWNQLSNHILVTSPAEYVFSGSYYFEEEGFPL